MVYSPSSISSPIIEITDLSAPQLAPYASLTRAQLQNRQSPENGLFIAESVPVIDAALDAGCTPVSLLMERRKIEAMGSLLARCPGVPVYTAAREVLAGLTGYALTRGVLCALHRPPLADAETVCRDARRIAVLESIVDTTNLGALFRSAAALGMDAVLLTPTCCDPLSRRSLRVSMGCVFRVPWAFLPKGDTVSALQQMGFRCAAMALSERAISITDPALRHAERLAIVLGTEGSGLSADTIGRCDFTVMIPMSGGVDSLNVAAAGALAFWELGKRA